MIQKKAMLKLLVIVIFNILLFFTAMSASGQNAQSPLEKINWQKGPCVSDIGDIAKISVPEGYVFANGDDTRILMEMMKNPSPGGELGFIAPNNLTWYFIFEFSETGYVNDDEKGTLDAVAILDSIKKGNEKGNEERKKRGWPIITVTGWHIPPNYNAVTHNLEWAIKGEIENHPIVNFNSRVLGRKGVMNVTLVAEPNKFPQTMPDFKNMMSNFSFKGGNRYEEFVKGDKVAEYGLSALIVGGATAVAVKSGIFKWLWKLLVFLGIAVAAFFKKIFGRKS